MSFTGTGLEDLELILNTFPRTFTVQDVVNQFGWTNGRARQAIVNGQQNDSLRTNTERVTNHGISQLAIYENNRWRAEWIKRAWGPHHERNMDREGQQHS
jgi:hypothetical protein